MDGYSPIQETKFILTLKFQIQDIRMQHLDLLTDIGNFVVRTIFVNLNLRQILTLV